MVLCAFAIAPERESELREMGVRDSKELTAEKREKLAEKLFELGDCVVRKLSAAEITQLMRRRVSLNDIEAKEISTALQELGGKKVLSKVFVDSPDPVASKFERRIRRHFRHSFEIVCEHKADSRYAVVGAASIIAKVERDAGIAEIKKFLRKEAGVEADFGTGYSHDEKTIKFLKKYRGLPELQEFIRHQWATAKNLKYEQIDLGKFL